MEKPVNMHNFQRGYLGKYLRMQSRQSIFMSKVNVKRTKLRYKLNRYFLSSTAEGNNRLDRGAETYEQALCNHKAKASCRRWKIRVLGILDEP